MRINRLDLTRYGKFTGKSIEFGPKPCDGPDFHIVYGLNEAGKSTALNGYLDLLYGIEERSRYAFLHDYAAMRVGGVLEFDGEEHLLSRLKQRTNSLIDDAGLPVGEMVLSTQLSGLSRQDYVSMFSLDDDTLEAGGKAILDSRGDLGELLFAAGAGLSNASGILEATQAEANEIYRKHAHGTRLALLKKELGELKAARDAIDTLASTYETLSAERLDAIANYDRTLAERSALAGRLLTIVKHERALPMLADVARKSSRLSDMQTSPGSAAGWNGNVAALIADDASAETKLTSNAAEIIRLESRLHGLVVDETALALSQRIRRLAHMKSRYEAATAELSGLRTDLKIQDGMVGSIVKALGGSSDQCPYSLVLPVTTISAVRDLIEQWSGIETDLRAASSETKAAMDAVAMARLRVVDPPGMAVDVRARLSAALARSRESAHATRLLDVKESVDDAVVRWNSDNAGLHPWCGEAMDLVRMAIPSNGQLTGWRNDVAELRSSLALARLRAHDLTETRASLLSELERCRSYSIVPDDDTAVAARRSRQVAWAQHREHMIDATADAFETSLAEDDALGTKRLANSAALQQMRGATAGLAEAEESLGRSRVEIEALERLLGSLWDAIYAVAVKLAPSSERACTPELQLDALNDFLDSRKAAIAAWEKLELSRLRQDRVEQEVDELYNELASASRLAGLDLKQHDSLEAAMALVEDLLERQSSSEAKMTAALTALDDRKSELTVRERALEAAQRRQQEWKEDMCAALDDTWLRPETPPSVLRDVLDQVGRLSDLVQDRDVLRLRIDKLEGECTSFLTEVDQLVLETNSSAHQPPLQAADLLLARLEQAERANEAKTAHLGDLARLRDCREELQAEQATHEARKTAALRAFGVETLTEVLERQDALKERALLETAISELRERIVADLGVQDFETAVAELHVVEATSLVMERAEVEKRLEGIEATLAQQLIRRTRADDRLEAIGSDSAVARLDARRRTVLLEIEDKATEYLRLKIGTLAASNALREYRDHHRSGMMRRASDAFAMMTCGAYSGLSSQSTKGGDVLIALQRDGRSKLADALSKGTRFQLYLALRFAGYHEFANRRSTVPFIADDIMETFDHVRSEEVFRLFGEMGKLGQVIYLTHHRHLCEIAKSVVPGMKIHELA